MASIESKGTVRKSIASLVAASGGAIAIATLAFFVLAWRSETTLAQMQQSSETMTQALRNHVEADMMHDAMRATVLAALEAGTTGDRKAADEVRTDLKEYAGWLDRLHASNRRLDLPTDVRAQIDATQNSFDGYVVKVNRIVPLALSDPQAARRLMPDFNQTFKAMEADNERVSDNLQQTAKASSDDTVSSLGTIRRLIFLASLAISLISLALIAYLRRRVVMPIVRVTQSLESDQQIDLADDLARSDEIGRLAQGVIGFREASLAVQEAELARIRAEDEARKELAEQEAALASQASA
ncbi:MAG TPA: hypothetical protein PKG84_10855, partial [Novosphingobium sp.]|nr:hypothetical protein [Novosphingobium sp.]